MRSAVQPVAVVTRRIAGSLRAIDRPPQHVGPRLEVGAGQGRAVDDRAEPAVAGELGGRHLERPLLAAAADHQPQPGLLVVLVADDDVLEDPHVEVGDLGQGQGRVDPVELGIAGVIDDEELGRGGRGRGGRRRGRRGRGELEQPLVQPVLQRLRLRPRGPASRAPARRTLPLSGPGQVEGVDGDDFAAGLASGRDLVPPSCPLQLIGASSIGPSQHVFADRSRRFACGDSRSRPSRRAIRPVRSGADRMAEVSLTGKILHCFICGTPGVVPAALDSSFLGRGPAVRAAAFVRPSVLAAGP